MAGSQDMMMIVVMVMMLSSVFSVLAGGAYFFTKPQEGDECKGESVGGNYVIDEDGDCVLDYCDSGYTQSGGGCVVVVPDEDEDEDEDEDGGGGGGGGGGGSKARYVKIMHTGTEIINLAEIEVFDMEGVNVATDKPITASSNYGGMYPIEKFVDGTGTFGHTANPPTANEWVEIDLGAETDIDYVILKNRVDCCSDRIIGAKVQILDTLRNVVAESPEIDTDKSQYRIQFSLVSTPVIDTVEWTPRYVKIMHTGTKIINLAEIEVYNMDGVNVAQGRPVTASSNYGGMYPIEKFVDGTGTFGHTANSPTANEWVEINVGSQSSITKVVIKNRVDCCGERSVGLKVQILGQSRAIIKESGAFTENKDTYTIDFTSTPPVIT
jgi:hypothetical protein